MSAEPITVSQEWVRGLTVGAQKIPALGLPGEYANAAEVLHGIGLIQLDPLTRVSTAQRLTSLTRLPRNYRAEQVDTALWPARAPASFESFTKVACVFPLQDWPLLQLRRQSVRQKYGHTLSAQLCGQIRDVVGSAPRGVQIGTIETALDSARTTGWNWSEIKQAAELMVRTGELVITARDGVIRLFDLPARALPVEVREAEQLPPDELRAGLARRAAGTLAVMTVSDFAHHYHLSKQDAAHGIQLAGLIPVAVQGWREIGYVLPDLLEVEAPQAGIGPVKEARLVGPFDPLLRDRRRALRIFNFDYTFEAYVPKDKRVYGHYVMGVLSGTELIGRVDLWRSNGELVVNKIWGESGVPARSVAARAKAAAATLARQLGSTLRLPQE